VDGIRDVDSYHADDPFQALAPIPPPSPLPRSASRLPGHRHFCPGLPSLPCTAVPPASGPPKPTRPPIYPCSWAVSGPSTAFVVFTVSPSYCHVRAASDRRAEGQPLQERQERGTRVPPYGVAPANRPRHSGHGTPEHPCRICRNFRGLFPLDSRFLSVYISRNSSWSARPASGGHDGRPGT